MIPRRRLCPRYPFPSLAVLIPLPPRKVPQPPRSRWRANSADNASSFNVLLKDSAHCAVLQHCCCLHFIGWLAPILLHTTKMTSFSQGNGWRTNFSLSKG